MRAVTAFAIIAACIVVVASLGLLGWPWGVPMAAAGCAVLWWEWRDLTRV